MHNRAEVDGNFGNHVDAAVVSANAVAAAVVSAGTAAVTANAAAANALD